MEHYVTLFNNLFLPQGLALHASMERHAGTYTLWILCMDNETHDFLAQLALQNVMLLRLSQLETDALKAVKVGRAIGEYCWTLTPFSARFVFEADATVGRVTYLDADLWFRKNPAPLFWELDASGKHVLITDHGYAPEHDQSASSGQYCVQFLTFTRVGGEPVRKRWEEQCLEWCFAREEDGKFGDQKYLDDWPEAYPDKVHVLVNKELAQAPWNATRFPYGNAVFWHFHSLRIANGVGRSLRIEFGPYPIPRSTRIHVYAPYLADLRVAARLMQAHGLSVRPQSRRTLSSMGKSLLRGIYRQLWRFNQNLTARL